MKKRFFRLSVYVILLQLAVLVGLGQRTCRAEGQPTGKASGSDSSQLKDRTGMSEMFNGTVVDVIDAGRYVYVQIDLGDKRIWVAAPAFVGKLGDTVLVPPALELAGFRSKRLNRRFKRIYFVGGIRRVSTPAGEESAPTWPESPSPVAPDMGTQITHPPVDVPPGETAIETGEGENPAAQKTLSEIIADRESLAGREIQARVRIVTFTADIMGRNWLHVQDADGVEGADEIVVTTNAMLSVGDVVLIRGIVSVDRDFGLGLIYPVIIEDAEVAKE
jgi:hypothetical protein